MKQEIKESQDVNLFQALIGTVQLTPVTLRSIFLLLTRLHYSDPENYGLLKKKFANYIWSKDEKTRTLHIDFDYNYDAKNLERRPAIFVGLDDINFSKTSIGNHGSFTEDRSGESFVKTANTLIIFRHVSKSPDESLALADMTAQFYLGITPMIRDTMNTRVLQYEVTSIKSSRPFEKQSQEADQDFISDVIVAFSYNAVWLTKIESHRIKRITYEQSLAELST